MIYQGQARYPVREAVLHCAATKTGKFDGWTPLQVFVEINRWHRERGWKNGFGYHGFFMPDGGFHAGRPYTMIGAHVMGHNRGTLGFLLIESQEISQVDLFERWFTAQQRASLRLVLGGIDGLERVTGHNDYAPKLCPGFNVRTEDWL